MTDIRQKLKPVLISGKEVLPIVEGGKGISVSNGESSGAWALAGATPASYMDTFEGQKLVAKAREVAEGRERGDLAEASCKFRIDSGMWSPDWSQFRKR